jgi:hypothetical protein
MKLTSLIALILLSPIIFCIFFLACRSIGCYLLTRKTNQTKPTETMKTTNELRNLIRQTNGKFFSVVFKKKDGTVRVANGKDLYRRLLADTSSPRSGFNPVQGAGYESFVDRNRESWICAKDENLVSFKCGAIEKTF